MEPTIMFKYGLLGQILLFKPGQAEGDSKMIRMAITSGLVTIVMFSTLYLSNASAEDFLHTRFRVHNAGPAEDVHHHGFSVNNKARVSECLSCHDGSIAPNLSFCIEKSSSRTPGGHPVNRPYPPIEKQKMFHNTALVKAAGIKLVNGRVTCVSCHNLANPQRPHLVIEIDHSKLCLTCHIK